MSEITLIYHFQSSQNHNGDFTPARYRVISFFSEDGFLEDELLKEMAKSIPEGNYEELTFLNLDDLKAFALRVSEELSVSHARLISVQDYNIGVDGARDLKTYREIFSKYGELVVNEAISKKKGFLGKFFS